MKFFASIALIASFASSAYAQFTINSLLNVVVCQPSLVTWSGGTDGILPAGQPSANPLVDFGELTGTSITWVVNLAAGTSAFFNLRDSTGLLVQSGTFSVLPGSNTSCVGQAISTSGGVATSTPVSTGSSSSKAASSTGSAKPSSAAALPNYVNAGAAAMIGAALLSLAL